MRPSSTVINEHTTAATLEGIDRLASETVGTGAPADAIELIVVDQDERIVQRRRMRTEVGPTRV